ncbi:hypothetical protein [Bosea sp. AS-1]|uniref:hypothetical protein n=1 Tax=Bosea sp. AS-1 TaxID=2015316 RepID=UPI000B777BC8|nr:hypothetical protein [Bosea sp. AS-1]
MDITRHAQLRGIQRSIPAEIVATIFAYGTQHKAPGRAIRLMFDRASIALAADGSDRRRSELERYNGVYLVVGEHGRVVTAARRYRRWFN